MLDFVLWIAAISFFSSLIAVIYMSVHYKKIQIERRIAPFMLLSDESNSDYLEGKQEHSFKERILNPIFQKLQQFFVKKMPKQKIKELENKLRDAGNPFGLVGIDFLILQIAISIGFVLLLFILFLPNTDQLGKILFLGIFAFLFIIFYSNNYLNTKKKQRIQEIEKTMPDFFDMVTISIEAGMGLDGALKRVCQQMDGPLSDEFMFSIEDMKLGKSRKQAFSEMRNRVASDFLKSVISALIQADQMGIGISKVLQAQTQRIREQQRQKVKEQAMKAPVKMLIPMVLFIFPTLFIVLIGPALIQLVTTWL